MKEDKHDNKSRLQDRKRIGQGGPEVLAGPSGRCRKIQETMRFLGGMIGSLYSHEDQDDRVAETLENLRQGIEKGLPDKN
ncbi:hypothetical protein [uncultured Desulfuromusa sp.]|uniref:hypothetical protein n=1 Tax=uncultured Desulfuromusa sp. TaxID=219183 RepID=UPI002AA830F4|nr:hypothetical protein [uncultured Desulfuromusa sp.]